jgi:Fe-S cluster assembly ATP-binding protein
MLERDGRTRKQREDGMALLEIRNLQVRAEDKLILRGITLAVNAGEVHAIMGPNGSGKSTLARALAGHPGYEIVAGEVLYDGRDLLAMSPDERAREGLFMAFQYPVEIPGVNNAYFLKAALNARRKHLGQEEMDAMDFMAHIKQRAALLQVDQAMLQRSVNEGFSGGEKKRNEIFHMAVLEPRVAILDETDSGLDIDALKIVANGVNAMRSPDRAFLIVTHYQRLLNYIVPDYVHVLSEGVLVRSGGRELALELEEKGYGWLTPQDEPARYDESAAAARS